MNVLNPVLPGFNPDPSLLRVGEDYYIATSTFEWFPGVQIHHSKDLAHWETVSYALTDDRVLDMRCISDERVEGNGFTGSMLCVNCCDCQGDGAVAAYSYLDYREYL